MSFIIPTAFQNTVTSPNVEQLLLDLSRGTAIVLAIVYILFLFFQLKTHAPLFENHIDGEEAETPNMTLSSGNL